VNTQSYLFLFYALSTNFTIRNNRNSAKLNIENWSNWIIRPTV